MTQGEIKKNVCQYCAYAVEREENDKQLFSWCSLRCTYNFGVENDIKMRRVPYKYKHDTCEHFLPTDRPHDF